MTERPGRRCRSDLEQRYVVASRLRLIGLGVACLALGSGAMAEPIVFRHVLDNSPLAVTPRPNEVETEAVKRFHGSQSDKIRTQSQTRVWRSAGLFLQAFGLSNNFWPICQLCGRIRVG